MWDHLTLGASVDNQEQFDWDEPLSHYIEFYNSWGDVLTWHRNCLLFKYHELKADPVGTHKAMTDYWGLNIPEECIKEAFARVTKIAMKTKLSKDQVSSGLRVSYRKKRKVINENIFNYIINRLQSDLIYDFGFNYDLSHDYGHFYD